MPPLGEFLKQIVTSAWDIAALGLPVVVLIDLNGKLHRSAKARRGS